MQDRLAQIESRLSNIEARLDALEGSAAQTRRRAWEPPDASLDESFVSNFATQIGRVLLIFGGAYLLRSMTDFQFVPTPVGLSMGATYALFWLFMAWRKGRIDGQRAAAEFFGGTSVFLALPLLVEATTKFQLLSGGQGFIALTIYTALALSVAVVSNLRILGWLVTAGGIATAFALLIVAHIALLVTVYLLVLGLVTLWIVYEKSWRGLQWLGAFGANAGVVAIIGFSFSDQWQIGERTPLIFCGALLVSYLAGFALHSHVRSQSIGLFEIVQSLLVALAALFVATSRGGAGLAGAGTMSLILGACCYGLALTPESRLQRGVNFYYYAMLGMLLVIAGIALTMPSSGAAVTWSALALVAAWFSGRNGWVSLSLQSTVLLCAAAIGSGILATGLKALTGNPGTGWPMGEPWQAAVALGTVACLFIPVAQHSKRWGTAAGLPQLIVLVLSVWEVGGLMVAWLAPVLAGVTTPEPDLAVLAALRTAVLSAASMTLALSSRHRRWPEARWLVYPLLVLVGIKLFVEDFPHGHAVSLFVALAFVGSALLLVSRLLRRHPAATREA